MMWICKEGAYDDVDPAGKGRINLAPVEYAWMPPPYRATQREISVGPALGFKVWGLGFGVYNSGVRVQGLGFRV